jgi:hypothetical protein
MSIENKISKKLLIASGCSFTDSGFAWPYQLTKKCDFNIDNLALPSQGNGIISRKLINCRISLQTFVSSRMYI